MSKYATGKYAKAISDRSGLEFPYREMVREWNGSFVHVSEFEPKQPQLEPKPQSADGIALRHVRTARTENDVPYSIPENGTSFFVLQFLLHALVHLILEPQCIILHVDPFVF